MTLKVDGAPKRAPDVTDMRAAGACGSPFRTAPTPPRSKSILGHLSADWQVVVFDELQWALEQHRPDRDVFQPRSYCATRHGLLLAISSRCGSVDADALAEIEALPDTIREWLKRPKNR